MAIDIEPFLTGAAACRRYIDKIAEPQASSGISDAHFATRKFRGHIDLESMQNCGVRALASRANLEGSYANHALGKNLVA
jgi:hypothetical protein